MSKHIKLLKELDVCKLGIKFAKKFDSIADAWEKCKKPKWMLYLVEREPGNLNKEQIFRFWLEFSVMVCKNMPIGEGRNLIDFMTDKRSVSAVQVAEKCLKGEATREELDTVFYDASAAVSDAIRDEFSDNNISAYYGLTYIAACAAYNIATLARYVNNDDMLAREYVDSVLRNAHEAILAARTSRPAARSWQADLIRKLIGNPYKDINP